MHAGSHDSQSAWILTQKSNGREASTVTFGPIPLTLRVEVASRTAGPTMAEFALPGGVIVVVVGAHVYVGHEGGWSGSGGGGGGEEGGLAWTKNKRKSILYYVLTIANIDQHERHTGTTTYASY
jgi:hypothetical protein